MLVFVCKYCDSCYARLALALLWHTHTHAHTPWQIQHTTWGREARVWSRGRQPSEHHPPWPACLHANGGPESARDGHVDSPVCSQDQAGYLGGETITADSQVHRTKGQNWKSPILNCTYSTAYSNHQYKNNYSANTIWEPKLGTKLINLFCSKSVGLHRVGSE